MQKLSKFLPSNKLDIQSCLTVQIQLSLLQAATFCDPSGSTVHFKDSDIKSNGISFNISDGLAVGPFCRRVSDLGKSYRMLRSFR